MIHPHLVVTYRLYHESALFTARNHRVYSHYADVQKLIDEAMLPLSNNADLVSAYRDKRSRALSTGAMSRSYFRFSLG